MQNLTNGIPHFNRLQEATGWRAGTYDCAILAGHGHQEFDVVEKGRVSHQYQIDVAIAQMTIFREAIWAATARARYIRTIHHEKFSADRFGRVRVIIDIIAMAVIRNFVDAASRNRALFE